MSHKGKNDSDPTKDSFPQHEPMSGDGRHSGVSIPQAQKVQPVKENPGALEAAKKARFASTGEPPKAQCAAK